MENCLITKLKSEVQNDNLPLFNKFRIKVVSGNTDAANRAFRLAASEPGVVIKIIGNGDLLVNRSSVGKTYELPVSQTGDLNDRVFIQYSDFTGYLEISNKYGFKWGNLSTISGYREVEINDNLNYVPIIIISGTGLSGNAKDLKVLSTELNISDSADSLLNGKLEDFGHLTTLEKISITGSFVVHITNRVLRDLGGLTNIQAINISYLIGNIEDFVVAQRAAGRTSVLSSESISITSYQSSLKFNGDNIGSFITEKFLYWDASTITFDGTTINA